VQLAFLLEFLQHSNALSRREYLFVKKTIALVTIINDGIVELIKNAYYLDLQYPAQSRFFKH
jgi:hypothetical protein